MRLTGKLTNEINKLRRDDRLYEIGFECEQIGKNYRYRKLPEGGTEAKSGVLQ